MRAVRVWRRQLHGATLFLFWKMKVTDSTIILVHNKVPKSWRNVDVGPCSLSGAGSAGWSVYVGSLSGKDTVSRWSSALSCLSSGSTFASLICVWFLRTVPINARPRCSTSNNITINPRLVLMCRPRFHEQFFPFQNSLRVARPSCCTEPLIYVFFLQCLHTPDSETLPEGCFDGLL